MPKGLIVMDGASSAATANWAPAIPALTPVANRPLALHAADTLQRAGTTELIAVVDRRAARDVRTALGEEAEAWEWVESARPGSPGDAVLAAAELLGEQPFIVHQAEGVLVREHGTLSAALFEGDADATVFFAHDELSGLHVLGPAVMAALEGTSPAADGRRSLTDAVDRLADMGGRVNAGVLEHWWSHGADAENILLLNRRVLDALEPSVRYQAGAGSRVEGRVTIHPTAVVRDAVICGPAVIGAHAQVTDAYVGPYTAIGDGAIIDNAEIASSVVLPRARIRHTGVRVEDSIIGPGASVGSDFKLPRAMRLIVGRDAQITLG